MSLRVVLAGSVGLLFLSLASVACSSGFEVNKDPTTDPPPNTPPAVPSGLAPTGTLDLVLTADRGDASDAAVSFGLPFPQGILKGERDITLKNAAGAPVPITTSVLARWPGDGSIRSVLVAFRATLANGAKETWKVDYGSPSSSPEAGKIEPNPDGPIAATLSADFYSKSQVSGVILPIAANKRFAQYDVEVEKGFAAFSLESFGVDCKASQGRTYYDGPHAQYQRFLRSGDPKHFRIAHGEAKWFRENELDWYVDRQVAIHKCEPANWTPRRPLDWGSLRMMISQGMLDDYLVTGDPASKEAVLAMGEGFRLNLPALSAGDDPILEITERNLGWTLMGLTSYFALDPRNEVRDAMRGLVDRAIAWQGRSDSGALEHDIERADPDECSSGPEGASPFMTSLLVDGVMDYWLLTADTAKVEPFMKKLAIWYETKAMTPDKKAFRYLWNCRDDPYEDSSEVAELNILIGHVFGATYVLTKDKHWIEFGDTMADHGIEAFFGKRAKQWNQSSRSFGKYLGYRALGAEP
jgi:hypothetical protein